MHRQLVPDRGRKKQIDVGFHRNAFLELFRNAYSKFVDKHCVLCVLCLRPNSSPALYSAATGMNAQQTNMDVISNNLANVDTNGFKKSRADFQDLMYQTKVVPGASTGQDTNNPTGLQVGTGVKTVGTKKLFSQGNFKDTSNPLDVAIEGNGFFQITKPDGSLAYTRNGSFNMDEEGNLVTAEGYYLEPAISIPVEAQNFSIAKDGRVTADVNNQTQEFGRITLANFVNPNGLMNVGNNLYQTTVASGASSRTRCITCGASKNQLRLSKSTPEKRCRRLLRIGELATVEGRRT